MSKERGKGVEGYLPNWFCVSTIACSGMHDFSTGLLVNIIQCNDTIVHSNSKHEGILHRECNGGYPCAMEFTKWQTWTLSLPEVVEKLHCGCSWCFSDQKQIMPCSVFGVNFRSPYPTASKSLLPGFHAVQETVLFPVSVHFHCQRYSTFGRVCSALPSKSYIKWTVFRASAKEEVL